MVLQFLASMIGDDMSDGVSATPGWHKSRLLVAILIATVLLLASAVGGVWLYNEIVLQKSLEHVLLDDPRNQVVQASAHFDGWVDTQTIVFDITNVKDSASTVDVFRVFLQFAQAKKDDTFKKVVLAAQGRRKFTISGDYFHQLGIEYATQNPIYTVRTFPHHVLAMDGSRPFPEIYGGVLYVLPKELQQFRALSERWYLDDTFTEHK